MNFGQRGEAPQRANWLKPGGRLSKLRLGGLIVLIVAVVLTLRWASSREPVYEGRTASEWFLHCSNSTHERAAHEAFKAMGTNALPFLISKVERRGNRLYQFYKDRYPKLPVSLLKILPRPPGVQRQQTVAVERLHALGTNAQPAVPALLDYLEECIARPVVVFAPARKLPPRLPYEGARALEALISIGGDDPRIIQVILDLAKSDLQVEGYYFHRDLSQLRPAVVKSVPKLLPALTNSSTRVWATLLLGTAINDSQDALEGVLTILNDKDKTVSPLAATTLVNTKGNFGTVVPALVEGLAMEDFVPAHIQSQKLDDPFASYTVNVFSGEASSALLRITARQPSVLPLVTKGLSHSDVRVRAGTAYVLGTMGPAAQDALPKLRPLTESPESSVRYRALHAVHKISGEVPPLIEATLIELAHGGENRRSDAVKVLGKKGRGSPDAFRALTKALGEDKSFRVRGLAARALGEMGLKEAIPALRAALNDEWYNVKDEAKDALKKLGEP